MIHHPTAAALLVLAIFGMGACSLPGQSGSAGAPVSPTATPGSNWEEEYKAAGIAQGDALGIPCDEFSSQGATTVQAIYELSITTLYPDGIPSGATASSVAGLAPAIQAGLVPADAPVTTILTLQSEVAHEVCGF